MKPSFNRWPALPFATFALAYLTFIVVVAPLQTSAPSYAWFLTPLYIPLLLVAAFLLDKFLCIRTEGWMSVVKWISTSLVLIGCLGNVGLSVQGNFNATVFALKSGYHGKTYNVPYWDDLETIRYLRANPVDTQVYGGRYALLHSLLALDTEVHVRGKYRTLPHTIQNVIGRLEDGPDEAHIVWLYDLSRDYIFGLDDLRALPGLEVVVELDDGVIFKFNKANNQTNDPIP